MYQTSNSQIKKGAIISYFSIVFNIVVGLVYTPWMIELIGKSDYGLYVLVTSFLAYFLVDFGLSQSITRFISKYIAENKEHKINEFLGLTVKLYILLDLIILAVLAIVFLYIENIFIELTPNELDRFKDVFIIAGFFSLVSFPFKPLDGVLSANERFVFLKFLDLFSKICSILLIVAVLLMGYGLYALIIVNALVGIVMIVLKLLYLSRTTTIKIDFSYFTKSAFKELFNFSGWVTISSLAQKFIISSIPAILAIFVGTNDIAIFGIGMTIEGYMWTFANALNGLFLPKVSQLSLNKDNLTGVNTLMLKVGRIQLILFGGILIGFITLGKEFIVLWIGKDFVNSYYVGMLLSLTGIVTFTQVIGTTYIYVANKVKFLALVNIFAAITSLGLAVFLVPKYGVVGSAVSIFIGLFVSNIIGLNIVYKKILKLDIFNFFYNCHLKMLLPLFLSFTSGYLIQYFVPSESWMLFLFKGLFFSLLYVLFMWLLGMNKEEKGFVKSIAMKLTSPLFK